MQLTGSPNWELPGRHFTTGLENGELKRHYPRPREFKMPAHSPAARVADDCLHVAKLLAPRQNHAETKIESGSVTAIVNACLSAGNLLGAADKLDPLAPPPDGWDRKVEFGP